MTQSFSAEEDLSFLDENYKRITAAAAEAAIKSGRSPDSVRLTAVTKTVKPAYINHVVSLGADIIGENKVQELLGKFEFLTLPVKKHIIGHLQSNKVRKIIDIVDMIQSVDSLSLAEEISRQALMHEKQIEILLEVNIGGEASKTGLQPEMLESTAFRISQLPNVIIKGLMCVPPVCDNVDEARKYFEKTALLYEDMKSYLASSADVSVLSMGMSSDFEAAILEGANMIRVGSSLFGKRIY